MEREGGRKEGGGGGGGRGRSYKASIITRIKSRNRLT